MKARNKHTGKECEVFWDMCDVGRRCHASDLPNSGLDYCYNAVVDDYEFNIDGMWIDGLEYINRR